MNFSLKLLFVFLLLNACATKQEVVQPPPQYSAETMKTFEEIERDQVLEYYRQLRELERGGHHRTPPPPTPQALQQYQTHRPAQRPVPPPRPARPAAPRAQGRVIEANPEELAREIEQNITFYCMRHRNAARFSEEGSCEKFTAGIDTQCRDQFEPNDRRLFNCIRDKLQ